MGKLFKLGLMVCFAFTFMYTSCKKEDPKYRVQVNTTEGGIVNGQCGEYYEGDAINFEAVPNDGFYFFGWSDSIIENPRDIIVNNSDIDIKAIFISTKATVDLGLTSGNLWATCNIGSSNPWDYGNYYAWGETKTKSDYSWSTYTFCKGGDMYNLTKYNQTDNLTTLEPSDDAATVNWGVEYSMPTTKDYYELLRECYWVLDSYRGTLGYMVYKAKTDADKGVKVYNEAPSASYSIFDTHIFLPSMYENSIKNSCIWLSTLNTANNPLVFGDDMDFYSFEARKYHDHRCRGYAIRPIRRK